VRDKGTQGKNKHPKRERQGDSR